MAPHHIARKVTENYRRLLVMWECGWSVGYFTGALLHRRYGLLAASPAASPPALGETLLATPAQILWPFGKVSNAQ